MLTLTAPAKINLTLEVLGKRQDGFHEIRSVLQTINLCDNLRFNPAQGVEVKSGAVDWRPEESLVTRAVEMVRETTGCSKGVTIEVEKRIPLLAGLGGDSSDAAATLRGLNKLWELGLSLDELLRLSVQLGSDVAFFLYGGTALATGRGEMVTPLPLMPQRWVVLVVPDVPRLAGKTKQLYSSLKPGHYTDGQITGRMVAVLRGDKDIPVPYNVFENVAFDRFSKLRLYHDHIVKMGADNLHLAGSGPALFSIVEEKEQAEELYTRCQQQGLETYLTETLTAIDQPD